MAEPAGHGGVTAAAAPTGDTVLVVEDDLSVIRVLRAALRSRGYHVTSARTGKAALDASEQDPPAVILLDLGLPDIDGVELCRQLRARSAVPIIVVTAEGSDERKVVALDEGADDYVTKPFSMPELMARLRVALRHREATGLVDQSVLDVGGLRIDVGEHRVTVGERVIDLSPKEFAVLTLLARHAGKVLTHKTILAEVWGPDAVDQTQYLRVFAGTIRKKLADRPDRPRLVTEPGVGYRLLDPGAPAPP
jgi:two-component system, OmpR family, KDP operon response regulator KdpE